MAQKILAINDNINILQIYRTMLEDEYEIITECDFLTTLKHIKTEKPDLIIMDIEMQNSTELLKTIRGSDKKIKILVISNRLLVSKIEEIKDFSISKVLIKPFHINELKSAIKEIVQ